MAGFVCSVSLNDGILACILLLVRLLKLLYVISLVISTPAFFLSLVSPYDEMPLTKVNPSEWPIMLGPASIYGSWSASCIS